MRRRSRGAFVADGFGFPAGAEPLIDPDGAVVPPLDTEMLAGFDFSCRPGCGLCCFTSPRLEREDETKLRAVAADARILGRPGDRRIAARSDGGACQFLRDLRCAVHDARPAPCREFPITVHIGVRLQASLVLSCPGLALERLSSYDSRRPLPPCSGLDSELDFVTKRLTAEVERRRAAAERRRRRILRELDREGRWVDDSVVRERLARTPIAPGPDEFAPTIPPTADEGLELLPMFYDGRPGPVALSEALGGWQASELAPSGGARPLGVLVPPERPPTLEPLADRLLEGYLHYVLERDGFLAAVHLEMPHRSEGDVAEAARTDLRAIGSDVLARAAVRAKLLGREGGRLTLADVERGIRATDQDWLDRPTWGERL